MKFDRECGGCTECCTHLAVGQLNKPAGVRCEHLTDSGCGIYDERPDDCRTFGCLWLASWQGVPERDRPDAVRVILHADTESKCHIPGRRPMPLIKAREAVERVTYRGRASKLVEKMSRFLPVVVFSADGWRRLFWRGRQRKAWQARVGTGLNDDADAFEIDAELLK